ncbi:MAG: hypothetical protein FIA99_00425 [Ruminiclostridium sp.]|nr:hypothetical protein [Ruminiclostridium sp.]
MDEKVNILKQIDFGDIDGSGDPKLDHYFLDNDYWDRVIEDKTFFIIGKKGTGKSSIYRMINEQSVNKGVLVENKDFGDFPFEKLLLVDDQNFAKTNQYQSIWENLILNIFSKMIADNPIIGDERNMYFQRIADYASNCLGSIIEMHKEVVTRTTKTGLGLNFNFLSGAHEAEKSLAIGNGNSNISMINATLESLILNYFITCPTERKIVIQFDRLDDNYNQYQDVEQYYQSIISLFKVTYRLNQEFRSRRIKDSKIILYLRSDIFNELGKRDAESARWDDFCLTINWAIVNRDDWENPKLLQMINKRIYASLLKENKDFSVIFDDKIIDLKSSSGKLHNVFQYIVEKTMHRPRDLIQFCKYIQKETLETGKLYFRTIKNAEKNYGFWLVNSELANEINPILKNTESLYEFLKLLGSRPFSLSDFYDRYKTAKSIKMDADDLAYYLYDIGIFQNIDMTFIPPKFRSSFRNKGRLDRNMKIVIHPGVWVGINA